MKELLITWPLSAPCGGLYKRSHQKGKLSMQRWLGYLQCQLVAAEVNEERSVFCFRPHDGAADRAIQYRLERSRENLADRLAGGVKHGSAFASDTAAFQLEVNDAARDALLLLLG